MNEMLGGANHSASGKNGHAGNGHAGAAILSLEQARQLTELFLASARHLLAVDDLAADLPLRQLRVCMLLHEAPRTMSTLGRELGVSLSAMTQIADRLERARLVKRSFEGSDRRVRSLQLTARGQRIMQLRQQARVHRAASVVSQLSEQSRTEVLSALRTLFQACSTATAQASNGNGRSSVKTNGVKASGVKRKRATSNGTA